MSQQIKVDQIADVTATSTELNYTDGVTSSIQTQLDAKLPLTGGTLTSGLTVQGTLEATTVDLGAWTVTESSNVLYFAHNGTNKMKIDSSGNLTVVGDVTAFGSV